MRATESPEVTDLGEDSEAWLVTGTGDAHSAEEAVRKHVEAILEEPDWANMFGDYEPGDLGIEYREDWAWKRPASRTADDELDEGDELVSGDKGLGRPRFAGYMVML